jgi:hypothetical protein
VKRSPALFRVLRVLQVISGFLNFLIPLFPPYFGPCFAIIPFRSSFNQKLLNVRILLCTISLSLLAFVASGQHQLSQTKSERLYQKGSELVVHGNYGAARKVFSEYLEEASPTDPRRGEAEYYIAFSALNLNHADGEKLIDDYISHYPSSPKAATAYYDLALFFYNDNKFSKASKAKDTSSGVTVISTKSNSMMPLNSSTLSRIRAMHSLRLPIITLDSLSTQRDCIPKPYLI